MATLGKAIAIAAQAHAEQFDKNGVTYTLHPLRMMFQMRTDAERIVAVLHDVVEDTAWTIEDLRNEGFSEEILTAIDCLTRRETESYEEFIERAKISTIATAVKLADLQDNMDIRRLEHLTNNDFERFERYHRAWMNLRAHQTA